MKKPIIGIVGKPSFSTDMWHYMEIVDDIRYVLSKNNALAIGILPTEKKIDFKTDEEIDQNSLTTEDIEGLELILEKVDGVILEGGLVSNQYEEEIAKLCIEKDIPIMGICSGFNNLIRALDGTVHIDESTFHNQFGSRIAHDVEIVENSKLFKILKTEKIKVNSIHTCIANKNEIKGYKVVATCPIDGTVEAVELENKRFVIGIKWHPEFMETMTPIFEEFIEECSRA